MALHTELSIFKTAYDLLCAAVDLIRNMPRDVKQALGTPIRDECLGVLLLVRKANMARNQDREPLLLALLERLEAVQLLLRVSHDKRFIGVSQWARAVELTSSIGKQANGWRHSSAIAPAA